MADQPPPPPPPAAAGSTPMPAIIVPSPSISAADDMGAASMSVEAIPAAAGFERRILVAVRKRPRLAAEQAESDVVEVVDDRTVVVKESKVSLDGRKVINQRGTYTFDFAFDENCSNARIYVQAVKPTLDIVRKGGNAVFFAFGQTGSGKTHTMMGSADASEHGLYVLAARDIIAQLRGMRLSVSFYEIYGGKLFDLLNGRAPIQTLEDEHKYLHLVGLTEHPVLDHAALMDLMAVGASQRSSGSTHVNDRSSRSHAVLTFIVRTRRDPRVFSRIAFIDLAGSERAQDTLDLDKKTRAEGAEINKSLLALKECVRAMYEKKRHVPFRGSKLTQILRDSFAGNCVTVMFANVSPCLVHCDDTVNTLKYTDRIKEMGPAGSAGGEGPAASQSVEPDLCEKCGFPILIDDRALHVCPKQYVPCKYCKLDIVKSKMQRHLQECLEAPTACVDCGLRGTRGQITLHLEKCPNAMVACVHCHERVLKRTMDSHVAIDCQGFKNPCPLCRLLVARRDTQEHAGVCPHRQVPCQACGFLVRHSMLREHQKACVANQRAEMARSGNRVVPPTPSRLPPMVSPSKASTGCPTPLAGDLRVVPASRGHHLQPLPSGSAQTARGRPSSRHVDSNATAAAPTETVVAKTARGANASGGKRAVPLMNLPKRPSAVQKAASPAQPTKTAAMQRAGLVPPPPLFDIEQADLASSPAVADATSASVQQSAAIHESASDPPAPAVIPVPPSEPAAGRRSPSPRAAPTAAAPPDYPCRLNCGRRLPSDALSVHEKDECPLSLVACPFREAGCPEASLHRKDLVAHIEANLTQHLMLVHSNAVVLRRENEELRRKLQVVEDRFLMQSDIVGSSGFAAASVEPATSRATPPRPPFTALEMALGGGAAGRSPVSTDNGVPVGSRTPQATKRDAALFQLTEKAMKPPNGAPNRKVVARPTPAVGVATTTRR